MLSAFPVSRKRFPRNYRAVPASSFYKHRPKQTPRPKRHNWAALSQAQSPRCPIHHEITYDAFLLLHTIQNMGQNICFNEIAVFHSIAVVLLKISLVNMWYSFNLLFSVSSKSNALAQQVKTSATLQLLQW